MIRNEGLHTTRADNNDSIRSLNHVLSWKHARIVTVVMGKWSFVMHWGFPLTVSGKASKLRVCRNQHHMVVNKGRSFYHTYRSMQVLCAKINFSIRLLLLFFFRWAQPMPCSFIGCSSSDTWHHVMWIRRRTDIWHARYLFGICDCSRRRISEPLWCIVV